MRSASIGSPPRAAAALSAAIALVALLNVTSAIWPPGAAYVPLNLVVGATLLAGARRSGSTWRGLGLDSACLGGGVRLGAVVGSAAALLLAAAAAMPLSRQGFIDARAAGVGAAGMLYQVLLRIPVGTALFEELAFRGVLLDLSRRSLGRVPGTILSATVFGLWHVLPARHAAAGNAAADALPAPLAIAGAVVATAAAGLALGWLRDRSGSLAAPVVVHAAVNATAFVAAWLIQG